MSLRTKIVKFLNNLNWLKIRDLRVLGLWVFVIIVLLVTWSGIKAIQTNYDLQKQISQAQEEINIQKLQNKNLSLENQYYQTNQYVELSARQNFGLAIPGESELLVPQNLALDHVISLPQTSSNTSQTVPNQPAWQRNLQAWINFFMHRQNSSD